MPLRRTKRSDGRQRPRWKDGSHTNVENTDAEQSRCPGLAFKLNLLNEPFKRVRPMLGPNHERNVSTRDRPARTGADARIEESEAIGEVCLALRPYGRKFKAHFRYSRDRTFCRLGSGWSNPIRQRGTWRESPVGLIPISTVRRFAVQCLLRRGDANALNRQQEVLPGNGSGSQRLPSYTLREANSGARLGVGSSFRRPAHSVPSCSARKVWITLHRGYLSQYRDEPRPRRELL